MTSLPHPTPSPHPHPKIPLNLYLDLEEQYKGGPLVLESIGCRSCQVVCNELNLRRKREEDHVNELQSQVLRDDVTHYALPKAWAEQWLDFTAGVAEQPPGPINTQVQGALGQMWFFLTSTPGFFFPFHPQPLLNKEGTIKAEYKDSALYIPVAEDVWHFFHSTYGGGPAIKIHEQTDNDEIMGVPDAAHRLLASAAVAAEAYDPATAKAAAAAAAPASPVDSLAAAVAATAAAAGATVAAATNAQPDAEMPLPRRMPSITTPTARSRASTTYRTHDSASRRTAARNLDGSSSSDEEAVDDDNLRRSARLLQQHRRLPINGSAGGSNGSSSNVPQGPIKIPIRTTT